MKTRKNVFKLEQKRPAGTVRPTVSGSVRHSHTVAPPVEKKKKNLHDRKLLPSLLSNPTPSETTNHGPVTDIQTFSFRRRCTNNVRAGTFPPRELLPPRSNSHLHPHPRSAATLLPLSVRRVRGPGSPTKRKNAPPTPTETLHLHLLRRSRLPSPPLFCAEQTESKWDLCVWNFGPSPRRASSRHCNDHLHEDGSFNSRPRPRSRLPPSFPPLVILPSPGEPRHSRMSSHCRGLFIFFFFF